LIVTSTIDAISTKSILAGTIEGSLSVTTDCMEAAVVCFDGALIDISSNKGKGLKVSRSYLHPCAKDFLIIVNLPSCRKKEHLFTKS